MNEIGRPTDVEIERMEELADEYFEDRRWTIDASLWDDGDVHLEAFQTLGTGHSDNYPDDVHNHRLVIEYRRDDGACVYRDRLEFACAEHKAASISILDEEEIDF